MAADFALHMIRPCAPMGLTCSVYSLRVPVGRSRLEEPAGVFVQIDLHGPRTLSTD